MQASHLDKRAARVQHMFRAIAARYDLMNRIMSGGLDLHWRKQLLRLVSLPAGGRLLDLGTGTGDLARQALQYEPTLKVTAGDYTLEMMRQGRGRKVNGTIFWTNLDALSLPFANETFDVVVSAYLMRNVSDVHRAWQEQWRVLKPGGTALCLDTTPPPKDARHVLVHFYLQRVVPLLGSLFTGNKLAYTYLPESTEQFLTAEALGACMSAAGFQNVKFRRMAFDTMALHWGFKSK